MTELNLGVTRDLELRRQIRVLDVHLLETTTGHGGVRQDGANLLQRSHLPDFDALGDLGPLLSSHHLHIIT